MSTFNHIKGARKITAPSVFKQTDSPVGPATLVAEKVILVQTKKLPETSVVSTPISVSLEKEIAVKTVHVRKERQEKQRIAPPPESATNATINTMYKKLGGTIEMSGYEATPCHNFSSMGLKPDLLNAIFTKLRWEFPSPIQSIGISPVIDGRDLICQAQAGTGKTATYMIAGLQNIEERVKHCQIIVLSPTRELTEQTYEVTKSLASCMDVSVAAHIGGNITKDERGVSYIHNVMPDDASIGTYSTPAYEEQIVVATPGRLWMLLKRNILDASHVKLMILDEADKMLSQGFMDDIINIFKKVPQSIQIALYSATLSHEIKTIAQEFMNNPVSILVSTEYVVLDNQAQYAIKVANEASKEEVVTNIFKTTAVGQVIIFCNRKFKVDHVTEFIKSTGISVGCIHSDMDQSKRDETMTKFRNGQIKVLVGTDLIARGIDTVVNLVINYDIPSDAEQYVHRIGRTGRFGKEGSVINIIAEDDAEKIRRITNLYRIKMLGFDKFVAKSSISRTI